MKFKRRMKIEQGNVDLTPVLNVFFLLFIFFLFTSSFIFQPGINVRLPKAVTSEVVEQENIAMIVAGDGRVYLNDREISRDELSSGLRLIAKNKQSLLLKADGRVSHARIVEIWDMCRKEGVLNINIATTR